MKKNTIIDIAAFAIPAIIAFVSYDYVDMVYRVAYAIAIGLAFTFPIGAIANGADEEYRKNASTAEKINLLMAIVAFPILYLIVSGYYGHTVSKAASAWASLIVALFGAYCIGKAINYVVKLFGRD